MAHDELERQLAHADLCRFVAACYYEPGREFAEEALFDSMLAAARTADEALASSAKRLGEAYFADTLDDLLVDYTRLFLGPTDILAKPYGSTWLTGEKTLMQASTIAILDLYREGGFEIDDSFRDLPDHIAVELEFLYLLEWRACAARQNADAAGLAEIEALRRRLLGEHLGRWVTPFTAAVQAEAGTAFYRDLAAITRALVGIETARTLSP
jgi:TorA maturation chaperone TorD